MYTVKYRQGMRHRNVSYSYLHPKYITCKFVFTRISTIATHNTRFCIPNTTEVYWHSQYFAFIRPIAIHNSYLQSQRANWYSQYFKRTSPIVIHHIHRNASQANFHSQYIPCKRAIKIYHRPDPVFTIRPHALYTRKIYDVLIRVHKTTHANVPSQYIAWYYGTVIYHIHRDFAIQYTSICTHVPSHDNMPSHIYYMSVCIENIARSNVL